jgi:hypothetical protein
MNAVRTRRRHYYHLTELMTTVAAGVITHLALEALTALLK